MAGYFTQLFVRTEVVEHEATERTPFPTSRMSRDHLEATLRVGERPVFVATAHLESLGDPANSKERCLQFSRSLREVLKAEEAGALGVFCGDTNIREKEVRSEPLVRKVVDAWAAAGSDPAAKATWDMLRNDNLSGFDGPSKPRCRFDRIYISKKHHKSISQFHLVGMERMAPPLAKFPSDHFGVCCTINF
eukprot:m.46735 g.46735  ORF g.46735 m.46735 type:complete len:191 (-) comp6320_c0_seq1:171-743(-)